jgi:GIY-YIG catalytic domain-containing protein
MNPAAVTGALEALPMRAYDDLAARSLAAPPAMPGFYAWWQRPGALPSVTGPSHPTEALELLYVGIAPCDAGSKSDLRKRLSKHHRGAIGSSTLRLGLVAFLWEAAAWQPYWTTRPKLPRDQLAALAAWQREHLVVQWVEAVKPWTLEAAVVQAMRPPLNRGHNRGHPLYKHVGDARDRLREEARRRPSA